MIFTFLENLIKLILIYSKCTYTIPKINSISGLSLRAGLKRLIFCSLISSFE